jgi:hypothetical protein
LLALLPKKYRRARIPRRLRYGFAELSEQPWPRKRNPTFSSSWATTSGG